MIRAFRRWWAWWCHRHEWVVIYRTKSIWVNKITNEKTKEGNKIVLERCTCGKERARQWCDYFNEWKHLDLDWLNYELSENDIDIPARHQE
jgi:hypothetical protein